MNDLLERDARIVGQVGKLRFSPLAAARGRGSYLYDADGRAVLDLSMCAGAAGLGYGHPAVVEAVSRAVRDMAGASLLLHANPDAVALGEQLLATMPDPDDQRVWFGHAGSDANDAAVRIVQAATGRSRFISFIGSYHGGQSGSMAVSGHSAMTHTLPRPGLVLLPYPDPYRGLFSVEEVFRLLDFHLETVAPADQVAAVIVEPIMSDGGLIVPPSGFFAGLRQRCDRHGILLIVDEVKVGLGRSGTFHAFDAEGITPDVVTFGKGLGGGLPLSAVVGSVDLMDIAPAFAMMTTSGNPVSTAAGGAVLRTIADEGLVEAAATQGKLLRNGIRELARDHTIIGDVRGRGLAIGVDLVDNPESKAPAPVTTAAKVILRCYQLGVHLLYVGLSGNVLELTPALTIGDEEISRAIDVLDAALADVAGGAVTDDQVAPYMMW